MTRLRGRLMRVCLSAGLLAGLALPALSQVPPPSARPDIVVFLSDDHGYRDSPVFARTDARTPNLERLAARGLTFTHAFVASPTCSPSRAALLTGLMPARNGAEANQTHKREGVRSLTENLKALGYQVAAFGKVAHGNDGPRHGFDVLEKAYDAATIRAFLDTRDATVPLALFVGTNEPHVPWADPPVFEPAWLTLPPTWVDTPQTRYQYARYLTDVSRMDAELGEVFDLTQRRLRPGGVFLYASDNGAQWPFAKWNLYDAGIRSAMVAVWSGIPHAAARTEAFVSWVDILPTLIEIAGGSPPGGIDGRSFLPLLEGTAREHRDAVFTTHTGDGANNVYPIRSVRTRQYKYIRNLLPASAHTTNTDLGGGSGQGRVYFAEWLTAARSSATAAQIVRRYHQRPSEELYDVLADPFEVNNVVSDPRHAPALADLRKRLDGWMASQNDTGRVFSTPIALGADGRPVGRR